MVKFRGTKLHTKKSHAKNMVLQVDRRHVKEDAVEISESFAKELENFPATRLHPDVLEKCSFENSMATQWTYQTAKNCEHSLRTVVDYAEKSPKCGKHTKARLRLVTKMLIEDLGKSKKDSKYDHAGILAMLASHGNVCNVQKEIGINTAYSLMTNAMKAEHEVTSMKNRVLRLLSEERELIVEECYIAIKKSSYINSHPLTGFRNGLADEVGLIFRPDPDTTTEPATEESKKEFWKRYNVERITRAISRALNHKPRKIPSPLFVKWLEENTPSCFSSAYEFMETAYCPDTGDVNSDTVQLMLFMLGVLATSDNQWRFRRFKWKAKQHTEGVDSSSSLPTEQKAAEPEGSMSTSKGSIKRKAENANPLFPFEDVNDLALDALFKSDSDSDTDCEDGVSLNAAEKEKAINFRSKNMFDIFASDDEDEENRSSAGDEEKVQSRNRRSRIHFSARNRSRHRRRSSLSVGDLLSSTASSSLSISSSTRKALPARAPRGKVVPDYVSIEVDTKEGPLRVQKVATDLMDELNELERESNMSGESDEDQVILFERPKIRSRRRSLRSYCAIM